MIARLAFLALLATPAAAAELSLPADATLSAEKVESLGSYAVPTAPWARDGLPTTGAEGSVLRQAWRTGPVTGTLDLIRPLRAQLEAQGYSVLLDCEDRACGGFDFRFETEVLPEPQMHVDLGDFRFLSARREGEDGDEYVTLLASRTATAGYLQLVRVVPPDPASQPSPREVLISKSQTDLPRAIVPATAPGDLGAELEARGRAVLDDLSFETGSSQLAEGPYASLAALADYLRANPDRRITLVGHTDASGALPANVALSRARAEATRQRLIASYGIPADQIAADGVGFLMPVESNLTDAGRTANRRVEAVLTSTN